MQYVYCTGAYTNDLPPMEVIQKDLSTIGYHLDYLDRWEKLVTGIFREL